MRELLDGMWWSLLRRPGALAWGLFLLWETLGFRVVMGTGYSLAGLMDDAATFAVLLAAFLALEAAPRLMRVPLMGLLGLLVTLFTSFNAGFLTFFDTLLNLDSWTQLGQAEGASSSIHQILTPRFLALHVVVPFSLLGGAIFFSLHQRTRRSAAPSLASLFAGGALVGFWPMVSHETFLLAERNGLMNVGRQWVDRMVLLHGGGALEKRERILAGLSDTYNLPEATQYKTGANPAYPLLKQPVQDPPAAGQKLNVVVVLMESFRLWESGIAGAEPGLAPNLWKLAQEGQFFPNFYANAHQTVRGEMATLCSILPNFTGGQVYSAFPDLSARCLPEVLRDAGWQTHWISSYTSNFGNKFGFLSVHGMQFVHDDKEIKQRELMKPSVGWGPSDEDLADHAADVLDKAQEPFFAEVMTLTNHHPFNHRYGIPLPKEVKESKERQLYKDYMTGLHYTDLAVGRFMENARKRKWFANTVFIFLGDHTVFVFPEKRERALTQDEKIDVYFRVPFIIWAPGRVPPQRNETLGSQIDVAPTVLDLLGLESAQSFQGVSLLAKHVPPERRFAIMGNENAWSIRQGNDRCYASGQTCFKWMPPYCPEGYDPTFAGHHCFTYEKDMQAKDFDPAQIRVMDRDASTLVLERGRQLVQNNGLLLLQDAIFPPNLRAKTPPGVR
ncbi:MAG: LTA synthase family protein [Myxococcota bacterium]